MRHALTAAAAVLLLAGCGSSSGYDYQPPPTTAAADELSPELTDLALELIEAVHFDRGDIQVLDVKNQGTIPGLPDHAVIEVPCKVDRSGARPLPTRPPEPEIMGLISQIKAYEQLTIEAAIERDYNKALLALLAHPLGPDADHVEQVLDDIIETHGLHIIGRPDNPVGRLRMRDKSVPPADG